MGIKITVGGHFLSCHGNHWFKTYVVVLTKASLTKIKAVESKLFLKKINQGIKKELL
jgi:hypothetical protein